MHLCNVLVALGAECQSPLDQDLLLSAAEGSRLLESISGVLEAVTKVSRVVLGEPQRRPRVQGRL